MVEVDGVLAVVPARLASTRLARKALALVGGIPLAVCAALDARRSGFAVIMAVDSAELAAAAFSHGLEAVLTPPELPSGSDRVWYALEALASARQYGVVVNIQGDVPFAAGLAGRAALAGLGEGDDVGTAAGPCSAAEALEESRVKVVVSWQDATRGRALWFSRACAPWGEGVYWEHVGVYAWRRAALGRFCGAPPSPLEQRERLEQLRAMELGMRFGITRMARAPMGVDTAQDLARARALATSGDTIAGTDT